MSLGLSAFFGQPPIPRDCHHFLHFKGGKFRGLSPLGMHHVQYPHFTGMDELPEAPQKRYIPMT